MNKDQFYKNIKKHEELHKKTIFVVLIVTVTFVGLHYFLEKFLLDPANSKFDAFILISTLLFPVLVIFYYSNYVTKKSGLFCLHCKTTFSQDNQLLHISFTNKCPKCGKDVWSN